MAREGKYATLRMPSGEHRMIHIDCLRDRSGTVGNGDHELQTIGKAGRSRWRGKRSNVRGVAMNPVDHPMGGGEGRSRRVVVTRARRGACRPRVIRPAENQRTQKYIVKRRGKK